MEIRIKSKSFLIVFSLTLLILFNAGYTAYGCGVSTAVPGYYDTLSFAEPSIIKDPLWNAFYLKHSQNYGLDIRDNYGSNQNDADEGSLAGEWKEHFKKNYSITSYNFDDIVKILYDIDASQLNAALDNINGAKKTIDPMLIPLVEKKAREELIYLIFIREVNPVINNYDQMHDWDSRWEAEYETNVKKEMKKYFDISYERSSKKELNDFLKLRYGFQATRLAVLSGEYEKTLSAYAELVGKINIFSATRYKALGYKARALFKLGRRIEALKIYLDIFDQSPVHMDSSFRSIYFMNITNAEWDEVHKILTNGHKKTTAYFVQSLMQKRDHSPAILDKMLLTGAGETKTEALLMRLVQDIEYDYMEYDHLNLLIDIDGKDLFKNPDENLKLILKNISDHSRYDSLIKVCEKAANTKDIRQPAYWLAMASYLALLEGRADLAKSLLISAKEKGTKNTALLNQMHLIETLIEFQINRGSFADFVQDRLVQDIAWAKTLTKQGSNHGIYHSLFVLSAQKFLTVKDMPKALLCFASAKGLYGIYGPLMWQNSDGYGIYVSAFMLDAAMDDIDLEKLQNLLSSKAGNSLDSLLIKNSLISKNDILFIRAVKEARNENYSRAADLIRDLPKNFVLFADCISKEKNFILSTAENNFIIGEYTVKFFLDSPDNEKNAKHKEMDFKSFILYMDKIYSSLNTADPKDSRKISEIYFNLANIYYSIHPTNYPEISRLKRKSIEYTEFTDNHSYDADLLSVYPFGIPGIKKQFLASYDKFVIVSDNFKKAEKYYKKVLEISADNELKAKCCIYISMARNIYLHKDIKTDRKKMEYLYILNKNYKDTEYYKRLIRECPMLENFK